ncbi:ras-related protein Rab-5C-like [Entamoeba marina]
MKTQNNTKLKCVFIGDGDCGKSSFVELLINNTKRGNQPVRYYDYAVKNIIIDRTQYQLVIWDSCGQELYKSVSRIYYMDAFICVLMYDITNKQSFENIDIWFYDSKNGIEEYRCPLQYILIGNKCELNNERQVSYAEAQRYAEKHGFLFLEISVHNQINISSTLLTPLFELLITQTNNYDTNLLINNAKQQQLTQKQNSICFIV